MKNSDYATILFFSSFVLIFSVISRLTTSDAFFFWLRIIIIIISIFFIGFSIIGLYRRKNGSNEHKTGDTTSG